MAYEATLFVSPASYNVGINNGLNTCVKYYINAMLTQKSKRKTNY